MVTADKKLTSNGQGAALLVDVNARARVLVLDDDPALRELFEAMLDRIGCQTEICASSVEAINAYRSGVLTGTNFDCALIDLNIDEKIDGITVGRVLREIYPRVRLVLISGSVNPRELEANKTLGFDAVLPKPFSLKELEAVVFPCR